MIDNQKNRGTLIRKNFQINENTPDIISTISLKTLTYTSSARPDDVVSERLDRLLTIYSNINGDVPEKEQTELKIGIQDFSNSSHLNAQKSIFESIKNLCIQYSKTKQKIEDLSQEFYTKSKFTPTTTIDQYEILLKEYQRDIQKDLSTLEEASTKLCGKLDSIISVCQKYEDLNYKNSCKINENEQAALKYIELINKLKLSDTPLTTIADARSHARQTYLIERHQKQVLQNWKKELPQISELKNDFENTKKKHEIFVYTQKIRNDSKSKEDEKLYE